VIGSVFKPLGSLGTRPDPAAVKDYVSRALLRVRGLLISLFDDADVSDPGERDSFSGG